MKNDKSTTALLDKWLSGTLTDAEKQAFEATEDYLAYKDILNGVAQLEPPVFDVEKGLAAQKIYNRTYKIPKTPKGITRRVWGYCAAAVILVLIGANALWFKAVNVHTAMGQTQTVTLPDQSVVTLNADSHLSYTKRTFLKNRTLHLKGEAFFKVAKGASFTVHTSTGIISVLGTAFNVYSREKTLETQCFEGKVRVQKGANTVILTAGKGTSSHDNAGLVAFGISNLKPNWLEGKSSFVEVPLSRLIKELERQYDIEIRTEQINLNRVFTGVFTHDNLKAALITSFAPMNITYTFETKSRIVLKDK